MKEIKGNRSIKLDLISKQWVVSSYWELALIIYAPLAYHYEPISKNICKYIYTANAYRQRTDKLMFKSVISTVRWIRK